MQAKTKERSDLQLGRRWAPPADPPARSLHRRERPAIQGLRQGGFVRASSTQSCSIVASTGETVLKTGYSTSWACAARIPKNRAAPAAIIRIINVTDRIFIVDMGAAPSLLIAPYAPRTCADMGAIPTLAPIPARPKRTAPKPEPQSENEGGGAAGQGTKTRRTERDRSRQVTPAETGAANMTVNITRISNTAEQATAFKAVMGNTPAKTSSAMPQV